MPEIIDRGSPPQPTTAQPAVPSGVPSKDGVAGKSGSELPGRDGRISELVRKNYDMEQKLNTALATVARVEAERAEERKRSAEPRPEEHAPTSVREFKDHDLLEVLKQGAETNPEGWVMALREMTRREVERGTKDAAQQTQELISFEKHKQGVLQEIDARFHADATNKESPIYRRADELYGQLIRQYGSEHVSRMPELELLCFERAHRELHAQDLEELPRLRREADERKAREAMESGIGGVFRGDSQVAKALEKGDWRLAIKHLPMVQGLKGK